MTSQSTYFSLSKHLNQIVPQDSSKRSLILVKSDQLRVILLRMTAGGDLREHAAAGQITLHALSGRFQVTVDDETYDLTSDGLLVIERDVRHSVVCKEDGAFLLTIAWPHGPDAFSSNEA